LTYHFLCLQQQNNSALGVEYACNVLQTFQEFGSLTLGMIYW